MTTLQEIAFNQQLARHVRRHSCLYDSVVKYDKRQQENAWLDIVASIREPNITVDECKRKWGNLRNHFCRAKRAGEVHYLDADLSFLLPHLKLNLKRKSTEARTDTLVNPLTNLMLRSILAMNQNVGANAAPSNVPQSSQHTRGATPQVVDLVNAGRNPGTFEEGEGHQRRKRRTTDTTDDRKPSEPENERAQFMHNVVMIVQAMDEEQWKNFRYRVNVIVDEILG